MVALPVTPPASVLRLAQRARCIRTPLADREGAVVWHVWGQAAHAHPPLVLLHGGSGSWTHWLRNIDALAASGREVWAVDIPGFGDSGAVGQDVDAVIEPLHQSLQSLFGEQVCDLVGFSFGAMTAGLLEAAHPGRARRLVLVGAPALTEQRANRVTLRGWRHLADGEAQQRVHRHNLAVLMLADAGRIDDATLALHAHNVARDRMQRRRLSNTDILARALRQVRCPVHVIYGEHDALYLERFDELQAAVRATGCDGRGFTLVPDAGHWAQYEQPQAFDRVLLGALGATPA
ncbi:MAG: alpha/beta hydrolase [Burkholderiales bacterium 66-5]|nr:MAG: alpha/beta hydrolase [Burkholderiales bacterium 66-5]